jgi:DNA-binding CsgD family transcriptional regulator
MAWHSIGQKAMRSITALHLTDAPEVQWRLYRGARLRTIGCSTRADIRLPRRFTRVGRVHAAVWVDESGSWIRDLGTPFSTTINSTPIAPEVAVRIVPGDRLGIGDAALEVASEVQLLTLHSPGPTTGVSAHLAPAATSNLEKVEDFTPAIGVQISDLYQLSEVEFDIIMFVRRGMTEEDSPRQLFDLDPAHLRSLLASIFRKLRVTSIQELEKALQRIALDD